MGVRSGSFSIFLIWSYFALLRALGLVGLTVSTGFSSGVFDLGYFDSFYLLLLPLTLDVYKRD